MEARKSKTKVLAYSVFGEGPIPGLQMAIVLLYPQLEETEKAFISSSSYKGTNPLSEGMGAPPSWPI